MGKPLLVTASIYLIFGCNHHCFYCSNLSNFFDDVHVFHRTCSFFSSLLFSSCGNNILIILNLSEEPFTDIRQSFSYEDWIKRCWAFFKCVCMYLGAFVEEYCRIALLKSGGGAATVREKKAPLASFFLHKNRFCFCHWIIN